MKQSTLVFALLFAIANTGWGASPIVSEEDLEDEVAQLHDPTTQIPALERLIKFSGIFLYETSVLWATNDRDMDKLRRLARTALEARSDPEIVALAMTHEDRDVRFWGVMNVEISHGRRDPWKPLLPRLKSMAVEDRDSNIRAEAIRRVHFYDMDFIRNVRTTTTENSPWVLMNLFDFDSRSPELRVWFYEHAVRHLSNEEKDIRKQWLTYLQSNASLSSVAEMWRIESNPQLVAKLKEMETAGPPDEQNLATKILVALSARERE